MKSYWMLIFTVSMTSLSSLWSFEAKDYLEAGLYDQAIPLFQKELAQKPEDFQRRYLLAQAYFKSHQYGAVIRLLENSEAIPEALYLRALAYNYDEQFDKAIPLFKKYIHAVEENVLPSKAKIELALAYFFCHQLEKSKEIFEQLTSNPLAALYLSRIAKIEHNPLKAKTYLLELQQEKNHTALINYEANYLLGELSFEEKDFAKAISYFDHALPQLKPQNMSWYRECLYYLGWSHLYLAELLTSESSKKEAFEKAEHYFQLHLRLSKDEHVYLALGQCYLAHARALNDEQIYFKAEELLSSTHHFLSKETQAQALLLRAQAASAYSPETFYIVN